MFKTHKTCPFDTEPQRIFEMLNCICIQPPLYATLHYAAAKCHRVAMVTVYGPGALDLTFSRGCLQQLQQVFVSVWL